MRDEIALKIDKSAATQIDLRGMQITDAEINEIITAIIADKPDVEQLFLGNNAISSTGAATIAEHIAKLPKLSLLELQNNDISKDGIIILCNAKSANHPKLRLALYGNQITDAAEMHNIEMANKL